MIATTTRPPSGVATAIAILTASEAVAFLVAALLHLGVRIPLGFAVLAEPRIVPATIVEGLAGLILGVGVYPLFTRRSWARKAAIAAHVFAVAGVLLGMAALAAGRGPRTETNDLYHLVMLLVLVGNLILLSAPGAIAELGRGDRVSQPDAPS